MREVGPLSKILSIRSEAVHRVGSSRVSTSRVNVCKTIAIKHQLILNWKLLQGTVWALQDSHKVTISKKRITA